MVESRSRGGTIPLKIVVLGEARVGKTSLTTKFVQGQFDKLQPSTVDASYQEKVLQVGDQKAKLVVWDTAGQEKYHALAKNYYQGAKGKF
jgi:small GTP-binding protein